MDELTVYELMGQDHEITALLSRDGDVIVTIDNDAMEMVYQEKSHINAWESLVYFANQVLMCDRHLQHELTLKDD